MTSASGCGWLPSRWQHFSSTSAGQVRGRHAADVRNITGALRIELERTGSNRRGPNLPAGGGGLDRRAPNQRAEELGRCLIEGGRTTMGDGAIYGTHIRP